MNSPNLTVWYLAFGAGAACVFAVVVVVAVALQLTRRIGLQLADVADSLRVIRTDTAAIPEVADINRVTAEMVEILAGVRENKIRVTRGVVR